MQMGKSSYQQKLRHPRWQKQRLLVMQRDDWTCTRCRETERELHVHHMSYEYGREPWDYPLDNFRTLCCDCHEEESALRAVIDDKTRKALRKEGVLAVEWLEALFAEREDALLYAHLVNRSKRLVDIEDNGGVFDTDTKCWFLDGKVYDEDGDPV